MGFWNTSDGEGVQSDGEFETGGGNLEPMPEGTKVAASVEHVEWREPTDGDPDYVEVTWSVLKPDEYKNRKVFQKIRVNHRDPKKADKAKRMLAAIDANAGGKLLADPSMPGNIELARALQAKVMMLKLGVWELDDKSKSGNWVMAVAPRPGKGPTETKAAAAPEEPVSNPDTLDDLDDDIPF